MKKWPKGIKAYYGDNQSFEYWFGSYMAIYPSTSPAGRLSGRKTRMCILQVPPKPELALLHHAHVSHSNFVFFVGFSTAAGSDFSICPLVGWSVDRSVFKIS